MMTLLPLLMSYSLETGEVVLRVERDIISIGNIEMDEIRRKQIKEFHA